MTTPFDTVLALLRADPDIGKAVHDSSAPLDNGVIRRGNYLVVYTSTPVDVDSRLGEVVGRQEFEFTVRAVGITPDYCRRWWERAFAILNGKRLSIPNRTLWPIRLDGADELTPDDQASLFYWDQDYKFIIE